MVSSFMAVYFGFILLIIAALSLHLYLYRDCIYRSLSLNIYIIVNILCTGCIFMVPGHIRYYFVSYYMTMLCIIESSFAVSQRYADSQLHKKKRREYLSYFVIFACIFAASIHLWCWLIIANIAFFCYFNFHHTSKFSSKFPTRNPICIGLPEIIDGVDIDHNSNKTNYIYYDIANITRRINGMLWLKHAVQCICITVLSFQIMLVSHNVAISSICNVSIPLLWSMSCTVHMVCFSRTRLCLLHCWNKCPCKCSCEYQDQSNKYPRFSINSKQKPLLIVSTKHETSITTRTGTCFEGTEAPIKFLQYIIEPKPSNSNSTVLENSLKLKQISRSDNAVTPKKHTLTVLENSLKLKQV
eukprot:533775_1